MTGENPSTREQNESASTPEALLKEERSRGSLGYGRILLYALGFAIFLKFFVIEAYRIPTGSMEETLFAGDFLLVNKFVYGARTPRYLPFTQVDLPSFALPALNEPKRGDVVVFESPVWRRAPQSVVTNYVKRCVALPGDTLEIKNGVVFANGLRLSFPELGRRGKMIPLPGGYVDPGIYPPGAPFNAADYGPILIPKTGQEIRLDTDTVELWRELIRREGHAVAVRYPSVLIDGQQVEAYTFEHDYFFMMGDNRENSLDSRFWGFVPDNLIVGKAMLIYLSMDEATGDIRWDRIGMMVN